MNPGPVSRLFSSSKALVMLTTMAGAFVLVGMGRLSWEQAERFLMITVPAWMLAVGLEDAAKHMAAGKVAVASEKPVEANVAKPEVKSDKPD